MALDGLGDLMKQAQQMQEKMQTMQEEISRAEVEGESGAGLVKITMTGRHDVKRVSIDDSLLQEDKEVLEDLIAAALNDAVRRVEQNQQEKMSQLTAGIPMPPGFKFLSNKPSLCKQFMSENNSAIEQLIDALRILPGVGPKSAQRMVYHLLERNRDGARRLAEKLNFAMDEVQHCGSCRTFRKHLFVLSAAPKSETLNCCVSSKVLRT